MVYHVTGDHVVAILEAGETLLADQGTHVDLCGDYTGAPPPPDTDGLAPSARPVGDRP